MSITWHPHGDLIINDPWTVKGRPRNQGPVGKDYELAFRSPGHPNVFMLIIVTAVQRGRRKYFTSTYQDRIIYADPEHETEIARASTCTLGTPRYTRESDATQAARRLAGELYKGLSSPPGWDGTEAGLPAGAKIHRKCRGCRFLIPDGEAHTCTDEDRRREAQKREVW